MNELQDINHQVLRDVLGTMCLGKAGLAEGTTTPATIKTTNAIDYTIGHKVYSKAATDNIAMTAAAQQAVSTQCVYLVSLDAAGAVTVTKGTEVAANGTLTLADMPETPDNQCVIGAFKIVTDGSTTFTSGTTDLGAAGITETYVDLARKPDSVPL